MQQRTGIACLLILFLWVGCSSDKTSTAAGTIGPEGGTVSAGGASIEIPAGALTGETEISIVESPSDYPPLETGMEARGHVFAFLPHNLTFAEPVTLTVPFTGSDTEGLKLFMAEPGGPWAAAPDATISGSTIRASVTHLSYGLPGIDSSGVDFVSCACIGQPDTDGGYICVEVLEPISEELMCTVSLPSQCTEDGNTPADHCPAGFSGRCTHPPANNGEVQSEAIYNATDTSGLVQAACESGGGTWESGS